jgi:acetyltransferase-like isoleucine patch superfamily enzyme
MFLKILSFLLPWPLRRSFLKKVFKYDIHPTARIGMAWVFPKTLVMGARANIAHFTVAVNLDNITLGENAKIGRSNWITGFPTNTKSKHFAHQQHRESRLVMGAHSAITKHHHIDCTNIITIGKFATLAGYYSQLLTHSVDIVEGRQDSFPITIGDYSFLGTNVVLLGGAVLPNYSVLFAKSLLNKAYDEPYTLYGGVPAKPLQQLTPDAKYFTRTTGFIL